MSKRRKIVLIGAGSAVFTQGLIADFIMTKDLGEWEIALVDINPIALNSITALAYKMVENKGSHIKITSTTNRREVLKDADFVVTTIAVGGRRGWENDVAIPRKYGIYQPVGDTTMAGGISRAMRMIPTMIDIANDVKELCPNSYFFNYSNPMSAVVKAVREATGVKVIGLCHGILYVENYLAKFVNTEFKNVKALGVGINHITFLYNFTVNGENGWELVDNEIAKQKEYMKGNGHEYNFFNPMLEDKEIPKFADNPFSWSLYEKYGALPAVLDRHVVEFFPERFMSGEYYGHKLGIDAYPFEDVISRGDKTYENMVKNAESPEVNAELYSRLSGEHEQLAEMIRSLIKDERKIFHINVSNHGAVPNLPYNAVLELPAVATNRGFYPMQIEDYPEKLAAIIRRRASVIDVTVQAALTGDRSLMEEALLLDGCVTDEEIAKNLTNDLLEAHKMYLPQFNK